MVSDAPDAWHPMDMLVSPLYDEQGELRGTLAIDVPRDGRRPDAERRRVLERFAGLAARAVSSALESEALAEQVAMAETVKRIVRNSTAQLSLAGLLESSQHTLRDGFAAAQVWIKTVADDGQAIAEYVPDELRDALPAEITAFAVEAARYCWRHQAVMIVGQGHQVPRQMEPRHFDHVVSLLNDMGMSSLVFVPLGAGPECMGSLVLTRNDPHRLWTEIECAALLDIGHDLGRAALNARTFEREHALVTELRSLDVYKSQLIATVSHELKNPLTTVTGHLELLQSGTIPISAQAHSSLNAIGRASKRMSAVIEDLLYLRMVGEPERELHLQPVDLRELVADALVLTSMSVVSKNLEIRFDSPAGPVLALGEPADLDKVVLNLVSNAVKYTPEDRRIHISVQTHTEVGGARGQRRGHRDLRGGPGQAVHRVLPLHQPRGGRAGRHGPRADHRQAHRGAARRIDPGRLGPWGGHDVHGDPADRRLRASLRARSAPCGWSARPRPASPRPRHRRAAGCRR